MNLFYLLAATLSFLLSSDITLALEHEASFSTANCIDSISNSTPAEYANLDSLVERHILTLAKSDRGEYHSLSTQFAPQIQVLFDLVKTPDDFIAVIRKIHSLVSRPVTIAYSYGSISYMLGEQLLSEVTRIDFITSLMKVKNQFSEEQRSIVLTELDSISPIFGRQPYYAEGWRDVLAPIKISFYPEQFLPLLDHISSKQHYAQEPTKAFQFTNNIITLFPLLPSQVREQARSKIQNLVFSPFDSQWEGDKTQRRNRETWFRLLFEKEFQLFFHKINGKKTLTHQEAIFLVDTYWKSINHFPKTNRGQYSFAKVLSIADLIRNGPLHSLANNDYLLMYGSFANGKADIFASDVDVHPGPLLLKTIKENKLSSRYDNPYRDPEYETMKQIPTSEALDLSHRLIETEKSIADYLGVKNFEPSQLFTLIPSDSTLFEVSSLGYYNPILIKISPLKVSLLIYDAFNSHQTVSIDLEPH